MRKLKSTDVFEGLRLIKRSGLKESLVPIIAKLARDKDNPEEVGIVGILTMIEVFSDAKCEHIIYEWLSGPFERSPEEIRDMDLDELTLNLQSLAEENDLRNFFTVLSGLLSRKH